MNIQEGNEYEALTVGRQIYIGIMNCCRGYVEKLGNNETVTAEQKANLRAMATKSRPMKSRKENEEPHQPLLVNTHQDLKDAFLKENSRFDSLIRKNPKMDFAFLY